MDKILWDEGDSPSNRIRRANVPPVRARTPNSPLFWYLVPLVIALAALALWLKPAVESWFDEFSQRVTIVSHNNLRPVNP